jgi:hypothetical protein
MLVGFVIGAFMPLLVALLLHAYRWWRARVRAGRLRGLRVVVALLIVATFLLVAGADAQVVRLREGGGGGVSPGSAFTGQIVAPASDNCTSPPYSFSGDLNTGVCSNAADSVGIVTGGTRRLTLSTSQLTSTVGVTIPNDASVAGTSAGGGFQPYNTVQTPDATQILPVAAANAVQIKQLSLTGDAANGLCGTGACSSVAAVIHSATNSDTSQYNHLNFYGSGGGSLTTLTDNVATTFFHTPTLSANGNTYIGNGHYAIRIIDAAGEVQIGSGEYTFYALRANTGGTVCGIQHVGHDGTNPGLPLQAVSSGTLTLALDCAVASNVASFRMTANTSLTATTFTMTAQFNLRTGPAELIPQ